MVDVKLKSNQNNQLIRIIRSGADILIRRFRNIFLIPDFLFNLSRLGYEQREYLNFLHSYVDEIIQKKRLNKLAVTETGNEITSRKLFIDILLETYDDRKNNQEYLREEIITMILAGSDSTAVTLNFVIFMLANYPKIQEKVYQELVDIYGTESPKIAPVKFEDLQYMTYLDCVIKETLRLFPTIPVIGRYLTKDLELGEFTLPKGANIIIGILNIHRNEKYWPNPLTFDPDRFLSENATNHHRFSYIPFSDGMRACIGKKFGMMSMKVILAILVRTFIFKIDKNIEIDKIKLNIELVLTTIDPLKVKIKKRNFRNQENKEKKRKRKSKNIID